ncbi:MAG: phosphoribosylanthranilate isomerase [Alphaproteobacteria bacterium]
MIKVKRCGLSSPETVRAAIGVGADVVGFVFFARSPRAVTAAQAAVLARGVPAGIAKVGLLVDADDVAIADVLAQVTLDYLQLHGTETPERVGQIRARFGVPVIKAVAIAGSADIDRARSYEPVSDILLFDAKPPQTKDALPGGNGLVFDWTLIAGQTWTRPWMLSGGLDAGNLGEAVRISGAKMLDVSSGVESQPGIKDVVKIRGFVEAAKRL